AAIPGAPAPHVLTPEDVLAASEPPQGECLVYDCEGYFVGVGIAELLAAAGARVRLVTPLLVVAPYLDRTLEGQPVREHLASLGCELEPDTELVSIRENSCTLRRYGQSREVPASTVILATARRSNDALHRELRRDPAALERAGIEAVYAIGDCVAP